MSETSQLYSNSELSFIEFKNQLIADYKIAYESRQISLIGRKEVLTGKAKFGIFGDGKELAQIAMAKVFQKGDWRSGYYRDQTFAFASGITDYYKFFAQLYAHPSKEADPASAGRQMNCHFSTQTIDERGKWLDQTQLKNSSSDVSTTGGQMPRLVGLAQASKIYKNRKDLRHMTNFSNAGNEVAFGTIGNASTSEGVFFETLNAAGVLQIPLAISIWDDGYGISVPNKIQTTKEDISEVLKGLQRDENGEGFEIFKVRGWDYPALVATYEKAIQICREKHIPVMIHVTEMTQPQGHSSSGSHERYKSEERLEWEKEYDCIHKMRLWMIETGICTDDELDKLEKESKELVRSIQRKAWLDYLAVFETERSEAISHISELNTEATDLIAQELTTKYEPGLKDIYELVRKVLRMVRHEPSAARARLLKWYESRQVVNYDRFNSKLFTESDESVLNLTKTVAEYDDGSALIDGREILNACFSANFERDNRLLAFGEDVGAIGDVNQGFAGLQSKFGVERVFDTGIRENTIIGQGIGLALRGLRPIAEIQYLDYVLYGITALSDDLASLSYRTKGGQKAPLVVRTRGHRLEGIWHSGSPMAMLLNTLRGMHICVPRNMTQAAGMYNSLFRSDEPAIVIESLNGYRLKERLPNNIGDFTVPLGESEILKEGTDITVVSYGSTLRIVQEVAEELQALNISIEVIDPQTLQPFDINHLCGKSLSKTNRLLVVDEDMPGGGSAFILQQIIENQKGYFNLDGQPRTLTAKAHRPPYGSDGDYFTKPSKDDIIEIAYSMMNEANPEKYPPIFN